ncbi:MAG: cryptochrome/photolyase family protein [Flavobacteriaceae bacterium]|nr:cryptochrome/photolyase family protein [Flavobacteriaceae bacterium]
MNKSCCIILPNQLFKESLFHKKDYKIFLLEEYLFFNQYKFHKQKISFHRATMKFYHDYLKELSCDVEYIDSYSNDSNIKELVRKIHTLGYKIIEIYDPVDYLISKRLKNICKELNINLIIHDTKLFINSREELKDFFKESKKKFFQTSFYKSERKKRNVLIDDNGKPQGGEWTYDILNRKKFPKNEVPPVIKNPRKNKYVIESEKYVIKYFSKNYGTLGKFNYPTTIQESEKWLKIFLNERFKKFGDYEDAIVKDNLTLNHSILSPIMNVGFITPKEIIKQSLDFSEKNEIPINSTEGFIRQIMGWREFIRGIYCVKGSFERTNNYWNFSRKIPPSFYTGNTGIEPIDNSIKKVLKTGYLHHIERLMVLGNFMLLCEFDPDEVYKWFMELFIDSYDWVMVPNIYGMSQFADGGLMSTKPYISSSNYIYKMSDYKKNEWDQVWDGLFWRFMDKQRDFFIKNPRLRMLLNTFDKMDPIKKELHLLNGEKFLNKITNER